MPARSRVRQTTLVALDEASPLEDDRPPKQQQQQILHDHDSLLPPRQPQQQQQRTSKSRRTPKKSMPSSSATPMPTKGVLRTTSLEASLQSAIENDQRQEIKPKPRTRRLHWNHKVEKKRHHRLRDLSMDEKESVWYTEGDTKIILAMAKVTVKMMMKGEPCDDVDYCSRGLEGKTPAGSKRRQKNKLKVRKALLEEQEIQREEGVYDPEYLSQVSIKYSKEIVEAAHQTALNDEENIRDYLNLSHGDCSPIVPSRRTTQGK